jgi:F0F1-type ATP synthase membrane subunit c/vacuolar-type H+-ATPase subunit K
MLNPLGALNVNELKARLSKVRLFELAMIASIPMYVWVREMGRPPGSGSWTLRHSIVAAFALSAVFSGASIRRRVLVRAEMALAKDASDPKALKQWESGQVIGMAFAESLVLWGLVVRTGLGGALWQASIF